MNEAWVAAVVFQLFLGGVLVALGRWGWANAEEVSRRAPDEIEARARWVGFRCGAATALLLGVLFIASAVVGPLLGPG